MFPVDSAEMRVIIPIIDDDIAEDTESFMVSLSNPSNAVINDNQNHTVVWITDTGDCEYNNIIIMPYMQSTMTIPTLLIQ